MSLVNRFPTVIHAAGDADFTNFVYFQVYAAADTTATINGVDVDIPKGGSIEIKLTSISGTNVFVLGVPMNTVTGISYTGNVENVNGILSGEHLGGSTYTT